MTNWYQKFWVAGVLLFTLVSCARGPEHLRSALEAGNFKQAADAVAGDPEAAAVLAALVLEKAAATNPHRFFALERLSGAGDVGRDSLARLASGADETARAARIAVDRYHMPDAQAIAVCLADESADVRRMCAVVWHRFIGEGELKILLLDSDSTVRLYALRGLAALPADSRRSSLFVDVLLRDPSAKVRMEAALRGDLLGDDALLLLKDRLKDDRLGMRVAAVAGVATIGTDPARELLASIAAAPLDDEVTLNAAAALAANGDPSGTARLLGALNDKRPAIRAAALYLLPRANLTDASAVISRSLEDKAPEVVLAAANLLRNDANFHQIIIDALNSVLKLNTTHKGRALNLLAILGDESAEKQIADILKTAAKSTEAELSAQLAALAGAVGLFENVVPLLGDPRETVRINSAVFVLFSMSKI